MRLLHVTNGDVVVARMRAIGITGPIVPWRDVLHEGPVPAGLNAGALREVRAGFIASMDGSYEEVERAFRERDAALERLDAIDEVVLWFEHDLYDQLQLLQVLDRLPLDRGPRLTAVASDDYLSLHAADRFARLFPERQEVTSTQRLAARDAWAAFRADDPRAVTDVLDRVTALPHLAAALRRHLEQFPSLDRGLSRTEWQLLEALAERPRTAHEAFTAAHHAREDAVFMGDLAFFAHIRPLSRPPRPLMREMDGVFELTGDGREVLAGADRVALSGLDRWLGGVHLTGSGPLWRWDAGRQSVRRA